MIVGCSTCDRECELAKTRAIAFERLTAAGWIHLGSMAGTRTANASLEIRSASRSFERWVCVTCVEEIKR
jgi:hypothetical protein